MLSFSAPQSCQTAFILKISEIVYQDIIRAKALAADACPRSIPVNREK